MSGNVTLPRLLLKERVVAMVAVAVIAALCWLYLRQLGHSMSDMTMSMSPLDALILCSDLFMWSMMMAGMMLPGATPTILTFAALRQRHADGTVRRP